MRLAKSHVSKQGKQVYKHWVKVYLLQEDVELLEEVAKRHGWTLDQALQSCLDEGLESRGISMADDAAMEEDND